MATVIACNLSFSTSEFDLIGFFSQYGEVLEARKPFPDISYVTFASPDAGKRALRFADRMILHGNELKVYLLKMTGSELASIHLRFSSISTDKIVTEEAISNIFRQYGEIEEICIKDAVFDKQGYHKGYGFIHFKCDYKGICTAIFCAEKMISFVLDQVQYKCEMSKNLIRLLLQNSQMSTPESVVSNNSNSLSNSNNPPSYTTSPYMHYAPVIQQPSQPTQPMQQYVIVHSPPQMYHQPGVYSVYPPEPTYSNPTTSPQFYSPIVTPASASSGLSNPVTFGHTVAMPTLASTYVNTLGQPSNDGITHRQRASKSLSYLTSLR